MVNLTKFAHGESPAQLITIKLNSGVYASFTDFGAALVSFGVPDKNGTIKDIALGFDCIEDYMAQDAYIGALVGRYANRIENAAFELGGKRYPLYANDGKNHLHGGKEGFDKKYYKSEISGDSVIFSRVSPDGEEGYPGKLDYSVTYTLTDTALRVQYRGVCDKDAYFNPSLHAYFNLSDEADIKNHLIKINADAITENRADNIPTGKTVFVGNTAFDFKEFRFVGDKLGDEALSAARGYDHNFIIRGSGLRLAAELVSEKSGIKLSLYSDMPGLQFYSGNYLDINFGKGGKSYGAYAGLALEPQFYPDTPNKPQFPACLLKAGDEFKSVSVYEFTTV